jgi:hypothetical protein
LEAAKESEELESSVKGKQAELIIIGKLLEKGFTPLTSALLQTAIVTLPTREHFQLTLRQEWPPCYLLWRSIVNEKLLSLEFRVNAKGLELDIAQEKTSMKCPDCETSNTVTLAQIQREETIVCVGCQKSIKLVDENKTVANTISNVNDAIGELNRALEDFGK